MNRNINKININNGFCSLKLENKKNKILLNFKKYLILIINQNYNQNNNKIIKINKKNNYNK